MTERNFYLVGLFFMMLFVIIICLVDLNTSYSCSNGGEVVTSRDRLKSEKNVVLKLDNGTLQAFNIEKCTIK